MYFILKNNIQNYIDSLSCMSEHICLCNYNLKKIPDLFKFKNLIYLDLSHNDIKIIENIPNTVKYINLNNNMIDDMSGFKNLHNLKYLSLNNNYIDKFFNLNNLEFLEIDNNYIESFKNCPENLETLTCKNNNIKSMKYFPKKIKNISFSGNNVELLDIFC